MSADVAADGGPAILDGTGLGWLADRREEVFGILNHSGALHVRGFGLRRAGDLAEVARVLGVEPVVERAGFARRDQLATGVNSGSVWPPDQPMCHHHELSYAAQVPRTMLIGCLTAARAGGATGLADAEEVLTALPDDVVARFERDGWLLDRVYRTTAGLPWQDAFGTADRDVVNEYCGAGDIEVSWLPGDELWTRQHAPAVVRHPLTGRRCWVNQIAFLNEWTMDPAVREYLVYEFGADRLPFNTRYGDGSPIDERTIGVINDVYASRSHRVHWRAGDLLLLDNIQTAHSREPFDGVRETAVVLGDPVRLATVGERAS